MKPVSLPIALNLGPPALPRGAALFSWRWCGYRVHVVGWLKLDGRRFFAAPEWQVT